MRTHAIFLSIAILGGPALRAQDVTAVPNKSLKTATRINLPATRPMDMVGAARCDGSGNIYARLANQEGGPDGYLLAPIRQITPAGRMGVIFKVGGTWPEVGAGRGVSVDSNGVVYQAAIAFGGVYVVAFAKDGSVKSKTKLATGEYVDPWHLAVFDSGRFLVSGTAGKDLHTPYVGVFEAEGALVRRIYEPEDEEARKKADLKDSEFTHDNGRGNDFVDRGDATLGPDGNVYLLHGTSSVLLYVISERGEVIRKIRIGANGSGLAFRGISANAGQLAIGLARFGRTEVHITSLDGGLLGSYNLDGNEADVLSLACYYSRGFTFVGTGSKGAYLLSAER